MEKHPLLIAGFHRSGTSFVANLLHAGGLMLGEKLLGAKWSNPYGHYEDEEIVHFHDGVLRDQFGSWSVPSGVNGLFGLHHIGWITNFVFRRSMVGQPYGFKDPRLCLTIRMWAMALPRFDVLYIHRDPRACITSMWRRAWGDFRDGRAPNLNKFLVHNPDFIARMYLQYTYSFLSYAMYCKDDNVKIHFIDYEDVVSGKVDVFDCLETAFGRSLQRVALSDVYDSQVVTAVGSFVDLDPPLAREVERVDTLVRQLAEQDRAGVPRAYTLDGGADPLGEVDVRKDAVAYTLASERQRLHRMNRILKARETDIGHVVQDLERAQQSVDTLV